MDAQYLAIDNGCQSKEVKDLTASLPYRRVAVLCLAFFVEAINLCDLSRLVVPSHKGDSIRESAVLSIPSQSSKAYD